MPIWFKPFTLEEVQQRGQGTLAAHLGMLITEAGPNFLRGTMPVDHRTIQPLGLLHGGASVALAETLGSMAANYVVDQDKQFCVGLDINANHIRSVKRGLVTGTAQPLHLGASTQVWSITINNEEGSLVCISRLTMAVLVKKTK